MKKQTMLLLALVVTIGAHAQSLGRQVTGASGSSYAGPGMQADYTVGETATVSGSSGSFTVHQGFQQNETNTSGISEKQITVDFSLYPNPAQDQVTLSLSAQQAFGIKLSLTDIAGAVLFADPEEEKAGQQYKRSIPLNGLASGVYFLNLFTNNTLYQSIRFVKQ